MQEIFRDIPWYEWLYQVSNLGNVKSLNYRWHNIEHILKPKKDIYLRITLFKNNKAKIYWIHRLVLLVFTENQNNLPEVNHIDWNKYNNRLDNLEWCTRSYNVKHSYRKLWQKPNKTWLWKFWKLHHNSKKVWQYTKEWMLINIYYAIAEAKRLTNSNNINLCLLWKIKTSWWYMWKYC